MHVLLELSGVRLPEERWEAGCEREGDVSISNIWVTYLEFRSLFSPGPWCISGKFITRDVSSSLSHPHRPPNSSPRWRETWVNWGRGSMAAVASQKAQSNQSLCAQSPHWIVSGGTHAIYKQRSWKLWLVLQGPCASMVPASINTSGQSVSQASGLLRVWLRTSENTLKTQPLASQSSGLIMASAFLMKPWLCICLVGHRVKPQTRGGRPSAINWRSGLSLTSVT